MNMKFQKNYIKKRTYCRQRILSVWLAACLILSNLNFGSMLSYAAEYKTESIQIGADVTAEIKDGVLTVKGHGETEDFGKDTAPFAEYGDRIHSLVIENGVTYIGSCLFYGLGGLKGELLLPDSITGFGDSAFSGDSWETAPKFTLIRNNFTEGEVVKKDISPDKETQTETEKELSTQENDNKAEAETETETETETLKETAGETETIRKETESTTEAEEGKAEESMQETAKENYPEEASEKIEMTMETYQGESPLTTVSAIQRSSEQQMPEETVKPEAVSKEAFTETADTVFMSQDKEGTTDSASEAKEEQGAAEESLPTEASGKDSPAAEPNASESLPGHQKETESGSETETETVTEPQTETETTAEPETETETVTESETETETESVTETASETETETESKETPVYSVVHITEQEIENPDTLFFSGQKGAVICSRDNASFMDAAQKAGYEIADGMITVTMDDFTKKELPVLNGRIALPECPEEIVSPYEAEELYTCEFAGWTADEEDDSLIYQAGEELQVQGKTHLNLYSAWKLTLKHHFQVKSERKNDIAVYTLVDGNTGETPQAPDGYAFSYQWQMADKDVDSSSEDVLMITNASRKNSFADGTEASSSKDNGWANITGASAQTYNRTVESTDESKQFRCMIKAVSLMRTAGEDVVMYSDAAGAAEVITRIYVAQKSGDNNNSGEKEENAVKTLETALKKLNGKTAESNVIVLVDDYQVDNSEIKFVNVPVTIQGKNNNIQLIGIIRDNNEKKEEQETNLLIDADLILQSITLYGNWHIYGQNNKITIGKDFQKKGLTNGNIYLYGAGRDKLLGDGDLGGITVQSGAFTRIVGYSRSSQIDAKKRKVSITVGGDASVSTIIAGNASYGVDNANVEININGGKVDSIVGGCQGFNDTNSVYTGQTVVNVSEGIVEDIFGAGSGRNVDMPKFIGNLDIKVTGGSINNIYGSGSAAYITNGTGGEKSSVNVEVTGGTVKNIYAAGIGGAESVGTYQGPGGILNTLTEETAANCGSLTGNAKIEIGGNAVITGNIYASGSGYDKKEYGKENAYLKGDVEITVKGGMIEGNIFGGGKGSETLDYENCARVKADSSVKINIFAGTVEGNIYGGGEMAKSESPAEINISEAAQIKGNVYGGGKNGEIIISSAASNTAAGEESTSAENAAAEGDAYVTKTASVLISGGNIEGNVYGGGENAKVDGSALVTVRGGDIKGNVYGGGALGLVTQKSGVNIEGGVIAGAVYGGAFGETDAYYVYGGSTVNMTGGWVCKNVYGGSELSNDGNDENGKEAAAGNSVADEGLVFVNLVGGVVDGNVFGGGYKGKVQGSTHLHIGKGALDNCKYYSSHQDEKPVLTPVTDLQVGGSVYAGGDFGGDVIDYDSITVSGTSHVYIDGEGYDFNNNNSLKKMSIKGGVFGSGASCDAGDIRIVTLDNYGSEDNPSVLTSIQRADQVCLTQSHVRLTGQSDAANPDQTTPYSLNRIGDHEYNKEKLSKLEPLGNSLVLKGGSTIILDSASIEVANFKSVDLSDNEVELTKEALAGTKNTVQLTTGTIFRISHTVKGTGIENAEYGAVSGYSYMKAEDTAEAYAYARMKKTGGEEKLLNEKDGGFVAPGIIEKNSIEEMEYYNVDSGNYRYWQVKTEDSNAVRHTVLTAKKLETGKDEEFAVAKGSIELPPAKSGYSYKIKSITIPSPGISLVGAAKNDVEWIGESNEEEEKIKQEPLKTFGLLMQMGSVFGDEKKNFVVSNSTLIGDPIGKIGNIAEGTTPEIDFFLTYFNDGITMSQDLGTVEIELECSQGDTFQETIMVNVQIVTKASDLSDQTVELYATQSGSYTGRLIIPSGASRKLSLTKVEIPQSSVSEGFSLVEKGGPYKSRQVAVTMQPVTSQGWQSGVDFMNVPYDLGKGKDSVIDITIGTTDSRYEAPIDFTLYNAPGFSPADNPDSIKLTFQDISGGETGKTVTVTLQIYWKKSIISEVKTASGKQYNGLKDNESPTVTSYSSVSAEFTFGENAGAGELWLELQKEGGNNTPMPVPDETEFTLLTESNFYYYKVSLNEERIKLNSFKEMWGNGELPGSFKTDQKITVITEFHGEIDPGQYSLRLRSDDGADSIGADFTINNNTAGVTLAGGGDISAKGEHNLTLNISSNTDTRLSNGAAVVFYLDDSKKFPEGTVFKYNGGQFSPVNGRVYLVLDSRSPGTIILDTQNAVVWESDDYTLKASVFSTGISSGTTVFNDDGSVTYHVKADPDYGLKVSLAGDGQRVVEPGKSLQFSVSYAITNKEGETAIQIRVQRKEENGYSDISGSWNISGNQSLAAENGTQNISITVPGNAGPGTYRIIFTLGDKEDVYNIIVRDKTQKD